MGKVVPKVRFAVDSIVHCDICRELSNEETDYTIDLFGGGQEILSSIPAITSRLSDLGFGGLKKCPWCGSFYSDPGGYYELTSRGNEYTGHLYRLSPASAMDSLSRLANDRDLNPEVSRRAAAELDGLQSRCRALIPSLVSDLTCDHQEGKRYAIRSLEQFLSRSPRSGDGTPDRKELAASILDSMKRARVTPGKDPDVRRIRRKCQAILRTA